MHTDLFDFVLPAGQIALRPASPRDSARLLVVRPDGSLEHCTVHELPKLLRSGDNLVVNDSKVISARLTASRPPRAPNGPTVNMEVTLLKREDANCYRAFVQPARRLKADDILTFGAGLTANILTREGPEALLLFDRGGVALDEAIAAIGVMPLPPYITKFRLPDARDFVDYQTVYAAHAGSVAAPTAGLHLTPDLLDMFDRSGIHVVHTTLHVGAGTFVPVSVADTADHRMHAERATLSLGAADTLNHAHQVGGRVVAVGTTALRTLESATKPDGTIHPFDGDTDIFLTPGYHFRAVDVLLTNFHLPRSTLFMLVCAFMGLEVMQATYAEAIIKGYRFYSYGDACLLFRSE